MLAPLSSERSNEMADERSCAQSGTLWAVSSEGVVACVVCAREQGRANQIRFVRGTEGARLGAGYHMPRGMSASALPVVGVGRRRVERIREGDKSNSKYQKM